jgi:hypothetical protein
MFPDGTRSNDESGIDGAIVEAIHVFPGFFNRLD